MQGRLRGAVALAIVGLVAVACDYVHAPFLARVDGPVVVEGADMPDVVALGLDPDRLLGFRWDDATAGWVQIPVQVDERVVVDFGSQPNNNNTAGTVGTVYGTAAIGVTATQYADAGTWVGADGDPTFDADDEVVFLARDAGGQAPQGAALPSGVLNLGKEIEITDPTNGGTGYVYFFRGQAGADPSAGVDHVDYDFVLDSGAYLTTYKRADGPNPESSSVTTDVYTVGLGDRWITDEWRSHGGTGVDILDGHKNRFGFNTCGRSNATFADAEGAFIANIDGPVRAIRSYIGANSGPLTQRTLVFYEDRYEAITDLRVHQNPGVMDFLDFSAAAIGMEYGNSELTGTVTIDGSPDTVPTTLAAWEYVTGPQGVVTWVNSVETSLAWNPLDDFADQIHVDDDTPAFSECWGDGDFIGAAGADLNTAIPNTDPRSATFDTLRSSRVVAFWPNLLNAAVWAPVWAATVDSPVTVSISNY